MEERDFKRIFMVAAFALLGLIVLYFFARYVLFYFLPFIIALILTSLIDPVVMFLQRRCRFSRGLAVMFSLGLIIAIIALMIGFGVSRLFFELDRLVRTLPDYQGALDQFQVLWDHDRLQEIMDNWEISPQLQSALEDGLSDVYNTATEAVRGFFKTLQDGTRRVVNFFVVMLITFIATFFMAKDKEILSRSIASIVPDKWKRDASQFREELSHSVIGFIRAQFILISITTIVTILGLEIIGSNYSLILGILCGILDVIPILGPGLVFVPWIFFSFLSGDAAFAIMLIILYGTMVVVRSSLEPKVIGKNIGIHPLGTLLALYLGLRIFGPVGVILGPAIAIVSKAFVKAGLLAHLKIFR